jgi:hypothetical protein
VLLHHDAFAKPRIVVVDGRERSAFVDVEKHAGGGKALIIETFGERVPVDPGDTSG